MRLLHLSRRTAMAHENTAQDGRRLPICDRNTGHGIVRLLRLGHVARDERLLPDRTICGRNAKRQAIRPLACRSWRYPKV